MKRNLILSILGIIPVGTARGGRMATVQRRLEQASAHLPDILRSMRGKDTMLLVANWALWRTLAARRMRGHVQQLGSMPPRLEPVPPTKPLSIWLIRQGYYQPADQVRLIADMLQRQGHIVVMTHSRSGLNIETIEEVLEDNAELLQSVADEAKRLRCPVGMIGFSKGGCDLVHMGFHLAREHRVVPKWFTTVSSPLQGSRLAEWADYEGARELGCSHSRTVERLSQLYCLEHELSMQSMVWCVRGDQVSRRKHSRAPWQRAQDLPGSWSHWGAAQNPHSMHVIAQLINQWVVHHRLPMLSSALLVSAASSK